jgi:hypothetical protein
VRSTCLNSLSLLMTVQLIICKSLQHRSSDAIVAVGSQDEYMTVIRIEGSKATTTFVLCIIIDALQLLMFRSFSRFQNTQRSIYFVVIWRALEQPRHDCNNCLGRIKPLRDIRRGILWRVAQWQCIALLHPMAKAKGVAIDVPICQR